MYSTVPGASFAFLMSALTSVKLNRTDGDRQAARLNVALWAVTPYRLINPPMLDPPMAVLPRSDSVGYFASMRGFSSLTIQSRYALPRPWMAFSCQVKS